MKKNIKDYYGHNINVIICETREESEKINNIIVSIGGRSLHHHFTESFEGGTGYTLGSGALNSYCHKNYFVEQNTYKILYAKDFLEDYVLEFNIF